VCVQFVADCAFVVASQVVNQGFCDGSHNFPGSWEHVPKIDKDALNKLVLERCKVAKGQHIDKMHGILHEVTLMFELCSIVSCVVQCLTVGPRATVCWQTLCVPITNPELLALVGSEYVNQTVLSKTDIQLKRFASWGPKDKLFVRNLEVLTWYVKQDVYKMCTRCVQDVSCNLTSIVID
jgi:hypothetical protein